MASRLVLAWERCEACGRHHPTFYCRPRRAWLCLHCTSLLGCGVGGPGPRGGRGARKIEPDEDLIESLASRAGKRR